MSGSIACRALVGALLLGSADTALAAGPQGELSLDCTGLRGWAQDPDMPAALIDVHLYFGGPAGDPNATLLALTADQVLDAGCQAEQCAHGYRSALPLRVLDGTDYPVHAYGIDLTGDSNLELGGSPVTLNCPALPLVSGERRHVVSPEVLDAWRFSLFFDLMNLEDAVLESRPEGPVINGAPMLVVDAATEQRWLLDGSWRRAVSADAAQAWRLEQSVATPMSPAELDAWPEGTPLRPRPILVKASGPAIYLIDDHQCEPDDPDPSCVPAPEPGDDSGDGPLPGSDSTGASEPPPASGSADPTTGGDPTGGPGFVTGVPPLATDDPGGCGCRASRGVGGGLTPLLVLLLGLARRRRA